MYQRLPGPVAKPEKPRTQSGETRIRSHGIESQICYREVIRVIPPEPWRNNGHLCVVVILSRTVQY